jgi:hypothetical protein
MLAIWTVIVIGFIRAHSDPGISRTRGRITSAAVSSDYTTICMSNTTDAGSTYGDRAPRAKFCLTARASGDAPVIGACVVAQMQTESDRVQIERSDSC